MSPVLPLMFALSAAVPVAAPAAGDHALIVDIHAASAVEVDQLKHGADVRWWLELGDRLLIAGEVSGKSPLPASTQALGELAHLRIDELALRAVGCNERIDAPGDLLARGGRWQLRRLAAGAALPQTADAHERWRALQPNEVIARQYRLDAPLAAPIDPDILAIVQRIDTVRWFADLGTLAEWDRSSYGTTELFAARDWIGQQFEDLGLQVSKPDFAMPGFSGSIARQNVIGRWTGTTFPEQWIVVGAHYDSRNADDFGITNTPGAEDNASGCAGVIELARALLPSQPQRTILFMCYAGEEQGLYGSQAHVEALQAEGDLDKIQAVVIMDMIGYSADSQLNAGYESYSTWQDYLNRFGAAAASYAPELARHDQHESVRFRPHAVSRRRQADRARHRIGLRQLSALSRKYRHSGQHRPARTGDGRCDPEDERGRAGRARRRRRIRSHLRGRLRRALGLVNRP